MSSIHISVRTAIWKALVAIFKLPTIKEAHCPIKERKKVLNQNSATSKYYANHEEKSSRKGNPLTIASIAATNRNAHSRQKESNRLSPLFTFTTSCNGPS